MRKDPQYYEKLDDSLFIMNKTSMNQSSNKKGVNKSMIAGVKTSFVATPKKKFGVFSKAGPRKSATILDKQILSESFILETQEAKKKPFDKADIFDFLEELNTSKQLEEDEEF
jgi:hypothetical protein